MKINIGASLKVKNRIGSVYASLGIYVKKSKSACSTENTPMLFKALFTINKCENSLQSHQWMDKQNVVCMYNTALLATKKKKIVAIFSKIDRTGDDVK